MGEGGVLIAIKKISAGNRVRNTEWWCDATIHSVFLHLKECITEWIYVLPYSSEDKYISHVESWKTYNPIIQV